MSINDITICWIIIGLIILPINLYYKAPYGRHSSKKWGVLIDNKIGWILMELPALIVCPITYLLIEDNLNQNFLFIILWIIHYFNRTIIFPFKIKTKGKKMPLLIACSAFCFNLVNGLLNGYFLTVIEFKNLSTPLLITGLIVFLAGLFINITSDNKLIKLRENKKGYSIPNGGLFNIISCPNFFGEILEWLGFAIMTFNLASLSFFIWTCCNLIPRGLAHHRWYKENFEEYSKKRKAIIPYFL